MRLKNHLVQFGKRTCFTILGFVATDMAGKCPDFSIKINGFVDKWKENDGL